jgi:acyl-CoA thioesterase I
MRSVVQRLLKKRKGAGLSGAEGEGGFRRYGLGAWVVNATVGATAALALMLACLGDAAAAGTLRITAFGDSLTAGYGLAPGDAFPARLEAALAKAGIAATIANAGVSGDTTAGGLARIDWALADKPDIVILELGANDALRGIDPAVTRANLAKMLEKIQASGARVLLAGMLAPPNWGHDYQQEFDRIYPDLAQQFHARLYPFFLDGVATDPKLNQSDGLHPTAAGVDVIVGRIAPVLKQLIEAAPS